METAQQRKSKTSRGGMNGMEEEGRTRERREKGCLDMQEGGTGL